MQRVNERVKSMAYTSAALGISFLAMIFILVAMGTPWYEPDSPAVVDKFHAQLFFLVKRNDSWAKKAGDAGFSFMFMAFAGLVLSTYATYLRWAGRSTRLPSTAMHVAIYYGVTAFLLFLAFVIYAGIVNGTDADEGGTVNPKGTGNYGGGFALAIIVWLAVMGNAAVVYLFRAEVDSHNTANTDPTAAGPTDETATGPSGQVALSSEAEAARWRKLKKHSVVLGVDLILILVVLISLGAPWWENTRNRRSFGLIDEHIRHSTDEDLPTHAFRAAGDATFPFLLFALISQIYVLVASTLRFLGRTDAFTGKIPHSLNACLIANGISSFMCFLSFCIYAGVFNSKKSKAHVSGNFGGGFALAILDWLFTIVVMAILYFKRSEVDDAPAFTFSDTSGDAYPPPAAQSFEAPTANPYGPPAVGTADPSPSTFRDEPVPNPNYGPAGDVEEQVV